MWTLVVAIQIDLDTHSRAATATYNCLLPRIGALPHRSFMVGHLRVAEIARKPLPAALEQYGDNIRLSVIVLASGLSIDADPADRDISNAYFRTLRCLSWI